VAVLVEGISVVVRRGSIDRSFDGGWASFISCVPNATLCTDGQLARIGFMDPKDVERFVAHLQRGGLQFLSQGKCVDIAVVDQQRGSTMSCDWLELARTPFGKEGGRVAICWLFDGPRVAAGLHLPESSLDLAIPEGWTYEGSLSERFQFVPAEDLQSRLRYLRTEKGTVFKADFTLRGGKAMLPEEQKLVRLEAEQAELKEQVILAELALETIKTETAQFQHRYYQAVGRLYDVQLDQIDAQLANMKAEQAPDDMTLKAYARATEQQAKRSAEEAGLSEAKPKPPPVIEAGLKQAYRQAVKLMHPDLAITGHERQRRTKLMASVNLAYERGDREAIEKLIEEFGQGPEAIVGEDVGSRIVKVIRRIAQLRRRLGEVQQEIEAHKKTEIFKLRETIEKAEAMGDDPLGDLAQKLMKEISEHKIRLKTAHAS
jgi:hypothetical protein